MIIGRLRVRSQSNCASDSRTAFLTTAWSVAPSLNVLASVLATRVSDLDHQGIALRADRDAAGDDLRFAHRPAGLTVDGDHHGGDTVLGKELTVPEHHVANVPDAQAIHIHHAVLDPLGDLGAVLVDLEAVAVVHDEDVLVVHADIDCQLRVRGQVSALAVDRHEERGLEPG